MIAGQDVIALARTKIGQSYELGATPDFDNQHETGPWDCAEFCSWVLYRLTGQAYGARPAAYRADTGGLEAWTGHWQSDLNAGKFHEIDISDALSIPGAILLRHPNHANIKIGHIAFSAGNADTIEAKDSNSGVVHGSAQERYWTSALLIRDDIVYDRNPGDYWYRYPRKYWRLTNPETNGSEVMKIKRKLVSAGFAIDMTHDRFNEEVFNAVADFQRSKGLVVDGIVGPDTLRALGFFFGPSASS